ncbi:MAG: glycosyltransferase family 39 protein [Armatimonadetes bacterium]|nr:glycosyltransferase family 39 protein [Armatimonadota bacterium]
MKSPLCEVVFLLSLLWLLPIGLIASGAGIACLRLIHVPVNSTAERVLFGLPLGLGILAYGILALGLAGQLSSGPVAAWLAILAAIALLQTRPGPALPQAHAAPAGVAVAPAHPLPRDKGIIPWRVGGLACGAFLLFCLGIGTLAPPSGNEWDSLSYHLAVPKIYLGQHAIRYIPFIHHSNFPFLLEMLYTLGLLLKSAALAKSFHLLCAVWTSLAIYFFGRRLWSEPAGILGAVAFLSVPNVDWEATTAYIDLGTALFTFLSLYALVFWRQSADRRWLALSGLLMGLALGTKMFALATLFLSCVWIAAASWQKRLSLPEAAQSLALFLIPALLVAMPWYLKSYLYTGNPVYPFFYEIFGGRNWSVENALVYRQEQLKFGLGRDLSSLLLLPWNLMLHSQRFFDSLVMFATIGPLPFGFLCAIVFSKKLDRSAAAFAAYAVVFVLFWFVQMQQVRYLLVVLPLVMAAGAHAFLSGWRTFRWIKPVVAIYVASGLLFGMYVAFRVNQPMIPVAFGIEPREDYLRRTLDVYPAIRFVNTLPENAKVIFFHEPRGFYSDREYFWGNPGHHTLIPYERFTSARTMFDHFKRMGFTHVLVNEKFARKDSQEKWQMYLNEAAPQGLLARLFEANGVSVYRIL